MTGVGEPSRCRAGSEAGQGGGAGLLRCATVCVDNDDSAVGVSERTSLNAGNRSRNRKGRGARANVARPHGKRPEYTIRSRSVTIKGIDKMTARLGLLILKAFPIQIRRQPCIDHTGRNLVGPGQPIARGAVTVPRRHEPTRVTRAGLRDPDGQFGVELGVCVPTVGVRSHDAEVLLHTSIYKVGSIHLGRGPPDGVAAGNDGV